MSNFHIQLPNIIIIDALNASKYKLFNRCKLIVRDDENEEDRRQRACTEASRADIPQGALELAQSFRVFHKLMVTSREIFKKASANIVLYTEQQKVINHVSYAKNSIFFLGNS